MYCCPMVSPEKKLMNSYSEQNDCVQASPTTSHYFSPTEHQHQSPTSNLIVPKYPGPRLSGLELPTLPKSNTEPQQSYPHLSQDLHQQLPYFPSNPQMCLTPIPHSPLLPQPCPKSLPILNPHPVPPSSAPRQPQPCSRLGFWGCRPSSAAASTSDAALCEHLLLPSPAACLLSPLPCCSLPSSLRSFCWKFPQPRHRLHLFKNLLRWCSKDRKGRRIRETQAADSSAPAGGQLCLVAIRTLVLIIEHSTEI